MSTAPFVPYDGPEPPAGWGCRTRVLIEQTVADSLHAVGDRWVASPMVCFTWDNGRRYASRIVGSWLR